jgi:amino acid transporter
MAEATLGPSDSLEDSAEGGSLKGRMGTFELVFTVLAFAAPLATVSGVIPIVIIFGGVGAPAIFVAVTVLLLFFAVGLATMSRHVPNAGAFYAYVTAGLGRPAGLGAALLAVYSYWLLAVGSYAFLGSAADRLITDVFGGPDNPWFLYQWVGLLICGVLGYRNIELSAKVLSIAMVLEVLIVVIVDLAVGARGGEDGLSLAPLGWDAFTGGEVGVAMLFGVLCFLGFESTAIYREEARSPEVTIPRAMYLSVVLIGAFYVLAALMLILALGQEKAVGIVTNDPSSVLSGVLSTYLGKTAVDVAAVLLVGSVFASMIAVQNMLSRYLYSLGRDGVLPARLGSSHPKHRSPHLASVTVTVGIFAGTVPLAFVDDDPMVLYGKVAGVGSYAITVLMLLASIAVVIFFRRRAVPDTPVWKTKIVPVLSAIGLAGVVYLATTNFDTLSGITGATGFMLMLLTFAVVAFGMGLAAYFRSARPHIYERIGRKRL